MANKNEQAAGSKRERESTLSKHEKQTIKNIIASINEQASAPKMNSNSDSESYETSTFAFPDKPPIKTPVCYSINQVEVLKTSETIRLPRNLKPMTFYKKLWLY